MTSFSEEEVVEEETTKQIEVTVSGAVKNPGTFYLDDPVLASLYEMLELDENAACNCLDLNRVLYHEDEVYIPYEGNLISLNDATKEELMTINGIGEKTAEKIIMNRPFEAIEDIMDISGIGYKSYVKWREYLCL